MVIDLINQFERINSLYEKMIELTEKSFQALTYKRLEERYELQQEEERVHKEMILAFQLLKETIKRTCKAKGCKEEKLHSLLPFLSLEQREEILSRQKKVFKQEKKFQQNLQSNILLTKAMMEVSQIEVEAALYLIGKNSPKNSGLLVDRKL